MGSEQSHQPAEVLTGGVRNASNIKLLRGNTIAESTVNNRYSDDVPSQSTDSRPVSPPISVCSDSDLPYISYTDRPIGDSPKIRNKIQPSLRNVRSNSISSTSSLKPVKLKQRPVSTVHNIVIVKGASKDPGLDCDPDIIKIQNIPMFLPVMRGTLSLPSNRDPEILERLQPAHFHNICSRMLVHYNVCATQISIDQQQIFNKIDEVDQHIAKLFSSYVEKQKAYAVYAEQFSKIRSISQHLCRCNNLLNQNIQSFETLNNMLLLENRLEPFVWKTN